MGKNIKDSAGKTSHGIRDVQATYGPSQTLVHGLADALFTTTQQRVLGTLYGRPDTSFNVSELIASTGSGSGAVQRELAKLSASGLLTVQRTGNQKRYQANPDAPIHNELVSIVQKTVGLAGPLREALAPLSGDILAAFIYGSVAKHTDTASSDIDLMVIADTLGYANIMQALHPVIEQLQRDINPTIYSRAELAQRTAKGNAFIQRVLGQPKLWIIGNEHDLTF